MSLRPRRASVVLLALLALLAAPAARAQSGALYFPATGHFLTDDQGFLSFWRAHDGERLLGFPIAEASVGEGGAAQYFERGRLELHGSAVAFGLVDNEALIAQGWLDAGGGPITNTPTAREWAG